MHCTISSLWFLLNSHSQNNHHLSKSSNKRCWTLSKWYRWRPSWLNIPKDDCDALIWRLRPLVFILGFAFASVIMWSCRSALSLFIIVIRPLSLWQVKKQPFSANRLCTVEETRLFGSLFLGCLSTYSLLARDTLPFAHPFVKCMSAYSWSVKCTVCNGKLFFKFQIFFTFVVLLKHLRTSTRTDFQNPWKIIAPK